MYYSLFIQSPAESTWLLQCFGNYKESVWQALDSGKIRWEYIYVGVSEIQACELWSLPCLTKHHQPFSPSITSHPGAGVASRMLVPLTAPAPLESWPRGTTHHPAVCALITWTPKWVGGRGEIRLEVHGTRGQCMKTPCDIWRWSWRFGSH